MNLRYWLSDYRVLGALALLAAGAVAYFGKDGLLAAGGWLLAAVVVAVLAWLLLMAVRRYRARRAGAGLDAMVAGQADQAVASAEPAAKAQAEALRGRMAEAVKAIKTSRIGQARGTAALYELPWYVIIGNPAAGKSTAILNSGLRFPFEDNRSAVIHGLGGTRNCDWYFTTEGIVLDTAGRYSVSAEDRLEWLTFLDLLKKHRPRAPINGILIAASIAELSGSKPEFAIDLAKNLRQRVQELTERLEVHAPVYVVFTKADLINGFSDFFQGLDPSERENAWGATLPYGVGAQDDALATFDRHFDELADGLRETGLAQMAMARGRELAPGLLTMPMEFTGIKPALRTFIATLFEENPYQFKPVFRGFYFTSALQEGVAVQPASERVGRQFQLDAGTGDAAPVPPADASYFLQGLFRRVIFADRGLVRQYASRTRTRLRHAAFFGAVLLLGGALAAWTWSYTGNRQLVADVAADLDKAVAVQEGSFGLGSRIEALLVLQDRLEQLERYRQDRPLGLGFGLYQGGAMEAKLRQEYFDGMRQVMLVPVATRLEDYLSQVVANRAALRPPVGAAAAGSGGHGPGTDEDGADASAGAGGSPARLYEEASPTDSQDAYNALKTYLMLADPARVEGVHLGDQLTRFWRGWLEANRGDMPREDMLRAAGRLMSYHVRQADRPGWPLVDARYGLVDDSRQALRQVMRGASARDRVYAQIKARAATRFSPATVAGLLGEDHSGGLLTGSHQVSGAFTRKAWEEYVADAIAEAAGTELSSTDWVLESTVQNDLTLAGSPEHITRELTGLYKTEYAGEWQRFLQGVSVARFGDFEDAVERMNSLGDPSASPLRALLQAVNRETVWDNPAAANALAGAARGGIVAWFNRVVMRRNPTPVAVQVDSGTGASGAQEPAGAGPVGRQFAGLARLLAGHEGGPPLLDRYFEALGAVRSRFNALHTQGDPGPGARKLMQQTLDAEGSELSVALRLVDEQMLNGLEAGQREVLRPLLLRPLVQGFAALVAPTEAELNRTWAAQVHQPFEDGIGRRYPYAAGADVEAARGDIDRIFGPSGAIARFGEEALGTLVIRRGNTLTPRRWADIGISLSPELVGGYGQWVGGSAADSPQMVFQVLPMAATGREYSLVVDGQRMRYRNTPPQWHTFQLPGEGVPGVEITAVTGDGREVQVFNAPGAGATEAMFAAAEASRIGDQHYRLAWKRDGAEVAVELRIVSAVQPNATASDSLGLRLPPQVAGTLGPEPAGSSGGGVVASPAGVP
ncbi:type VI secretion system membrane subunit TssM [Lysobacter sp. GX 14042]|uniref:type VI secretion system membrane subunit TssM n=1 Tax=Lysobacter sp. GX 14042 TaxID=2907155 RepID=UPI001F46A75F|nr:type VI secretion system membrane subunit TssM [Lysobacter sp. GX 14042]MCE7032157.1 type VI secretion system membrane subunit TssM [Lysobacter sp. GX 14042]